jgi:hypothetical protein
MLEVIPNLVGTISDIVDGLRQLVLGHAKGFGPIAPFVILGEIDARSIAGSAFGSIVAHGFLHVTDTHTC